ncbi:MAG: hypothetical protein MZV70_34335 [Desulfobacterales bacterium]|nr:hypothetical protein [Desulfobacterales bacterium]
MRSKSRRAIRPRCRRSKARLVVDLIRGQAGRGGADHPAVHAAEGGRGIVEKLLAVGRRQRRRRTPERRRRRAWS